MKVLHLGKYYPPHPGGMESYLADLLDATQRQGVSGKALVHAKGSANGSDERVWRAPSLGECLFTPLSPTYPYWLDRTLAEFRPHLLHVHLPNPSAFWALASRRARRLPWLVHWHADVVAGDHRALKLALHGYRPLERRLLLRSGAVVATSRRYLESSHVLHGLSERTMVVPLGRDPTALQSASTEDASFAQAAWGKAGVRVLALGRMSIYKGFVVLLRALVRMPAAISVIAGPETDRALRSQVRRLGLDDRVRLLGYQPQGRINALLASCDCLCLPSTSRAEAFGLVLIEAMAHGKPVIASDIPGSGVGEVIDDGRNGRLFPPGDDAALAELLDNLSKQPQAWSRKGLEGQRDFTRRFHIDRSAEQIVALYRRLANR